MTDICAVLTIARKTVQMVEPSLLIFTLSSIKDLEPLLDFDQRALLYDIWNDTLKQFESYMKQLVSPSHMSGVTLYL